MSGLLSPTFDLNSLFFGFLNACAVTERIQRNQFLRAKTYPAGIALSAATRGPQIRLFQQEENDHAGSKCLLLEWKLCTFTNSKFASY